MNFERGKAYEELGEFICPKCGGIRHDAGNCMIYKCENCGYQECPLCGNELDDGYCVGCHGHRALGSYHSVGECPECVEKYGIELSESGKWRQRRDEIIELNCKGDYHETF